MITARNNIKPSIWCPGNNGNNLWRGCIGYWPLWEGSGEKANDISGNRNGGILTNMAPSTDWTATEMGQSLEFAGDDDYIDLGTTLNLGTSDFTFSAWINTSLLNQFIFGRYQDLSNRLYFNPNHFYFRVGGINVVRVQTLESFPINEWVHVVGATKRGEYTKIYWDGIEQTPAFETYGLTTVDNTANFCIGRYGPFYFNGTIALATIWNRALLTGEIVELATDPFCMIRPPSFAPFWDVGPISPSIYIIAATIKSRAIAGVITASTISGTVTIPTLVKGID